jgi:hypothetical protein
MPIVSSSTRDKILRMKAQRFKAAAIATDCGVTVEQVRAIVAQAKIDEPRKPKRKSHKNPLGDDPEYAAAAELLNEGHSLEIILKHFTLTELQKTAVIAHVASLRLTPGENG